MNFYSSTCAKRIPASAFRLTALSPQRPGPPNFSADRRKSPSRYLIDELNGKVHRRYGLLPNPTYIIDRSGRIAFRSLSTRPEAVREALEELIERQQERNVDHAVVRGGEDRGWPPLRSVLYSHRALERGGERSIDEFRRELGVPGQIALVSSRLASPLVEHPRATAATIAAVAGVLGLGLWVGIVLRRRRFDRLPYSGYDYARHESAALGPTTTRPWGSRTGCTNTSLKGRGFSRAVQSQWLHGL